MKTFREFLLTEGRRSEYHHWGIIHPSGKIISGDKDYSNGMEGSIHSSMVDHHVKASGGKHTENDFADYAQDKHTRDIHVRTYGKKSVLGAANALHKLPNNIHRLSTGKEKIIHDHRGTDDDTPTKTTTGNLNQIHNHLMNLHKSLKEDSNELDEDGFDSVSKIFKPTRAKDNPQTKSSKETGYYQGVRATTTWARKMRGIGRRLKRGHKIQGY